MRRILGKDSASVRSGNTIEITGWALDVEEGLPAPRVFAVVDDTIAFEALTGRESPAHVRRNADMSAAGFLAFVFTGSLALGPHSIRIVACNAAGTAWDLIADPIVCYVEDTMRLPLRIEPAFSGNVDFVGGFRSRQSGLNSIRRGRTAYVRGWAADVINGRPARYVMVMIDGRPRATVACELDRVDVAAAYANQQVKTSGFLATFPTADLVEGRYALTIAASSNGRSWHTVDDQFTLRITRFAIDEMPRLTSLAPARIDDVFVANEGENWKPVSLARLAIGERLKLRGWARDPEPGKVAGGVFFSIENGPVFEANYGLERFDAAERLSDDAYRFAGFEAVIGTDNLRVGQHRLHLCVLAEDLCAAYETAAWINFDLEKPASTPG